MHCICVILNVYGWPPAVVARDCEVGLTGCLVGPLLGPDCDLGLQPTARENAGSAPFGHLLLLVVMTLVAVAGKLLGAVGWCKRTLARMWA